MSAREAMIPRERVLTALSHREPDRVPWGEHFVDFNVVESVLGRKTLYHAKIHEIRALWDGRRDEVVRCYVNDYPEMARKLGFDIVTVQRVPSRTDVFKPMTPVDAETYRDDKGNLYRVSNSTHELDPYRVAPAPVPVPTKETLKADIAEFESKGPEQPDDSVWDMVRPVVKAMKKTHFIALLTGGIHWPSFGIGEEFWMNLAQYPELHALLAELYGKQSIASLKQYAAEGIDAVIGTDDYGTTRGLWANPSIFRDHIFPWMKLYCTEAHRLGMKAMIHSCGRIWDIMDLIVEAGYDAYESIQSGAGMDIKLLKERYGDRITLWGGVTNENLIMGTPEGVAADARYALKWAAPGGGFIYGASHSLAVGTKPENLRAMKECRDKYGRYPIPL